MHVRSTSDDKIVS